MYNMSDAIMSDKAHEFWSEIRKLKVHNTVISNSIDGCNDNDDMAPCDTTYKRWNCHSGHKLLCKLCRTFPPSALGARFTVFCASPPCGHAGWMARLLINAGDVETNPGPTTLNKRVWICDIC